MVFKMAFNKDQIKLLNKIGVSIDFSKDLTDADYESIEESVSSYLQKNGFDKNYQPTEEGMVCESILDML